MDTSVKIQLCNHLEEFISSNKRNLMAQALKERTKHILPVLEDIYQSQNASAVVRTCDCLGIQEMHAIEGINPYRINPQVTLGSAKWVEIVRHGKESTIAEVLHDLKYRGYKIISTTPHKTGYLPEEMPLQHKLAIIFGRELAGLSKTATDLSDYFVRIPMYGFTESYNISVSAGILLY
ncbi:MAG: RNA methyltransferase, partial [Bacteroidales bacterium]|nr:RNA methyltransferase [Bacteroidales bacterium]